MPAFLTQFARADDGLSAPRSITRFPGAGRISAVPASRFFKALGVCTAILIPSVMASPQCWHWFVIPLFLCGLICALDGLQIFESDRNLFSPVPLVGIFGIYFFYVAPLLHVVLDYWFINSNFSPLGQPDDWRTWLGFMGVINLGGLVIYRFCSRRFAARLSRRPLKNAFLINRQSLQFWAFILLPLAFLSQAYIYRIFGGIGGFVAAFDARNGENQFLGLGWLMCIAESFPVMLLIVWAAHSRKWGAARIATLLVVMFGLIIIFGGLRGSRGNSVFAILYAAGIIHNRVRRLNWRFLALLAGFLIPFMYLYGFYKVSGDTFVDATGSVQSMTTEAERTGRTFEGVLLGDLDRADIQAYTLFQLVDSPDDREYAYGRTYTDAVLNFIPHAIFPDRPPGKLKYGTDLFFGDGRYSPEGGLVSTKIYGVAGEAMLNWGPLGAFAGFVFLGLAVGWANAFTKRLSPSDSRQFVVPIIAILCVVALSNDFDNVIYVFLRQAMMPAILIWLGSTRVKADQRR